MLRKDRQEEDRRHSWKPPQDEQDPHLIPDDCYEEKGFAGTEEHERDYAALHELLLNSLFEDAKARQQLAQQSPPSSPMKPPVDDEGYVTPTHSHKTVSITTPVRTGGEYAERTGGGYRLKRKSSNHSASSWNSRTSLHSKHSKYSKVSRTSSTSTKSDLLTPSSHQFKRSLGKRRRIHALPLLKVLRPRRYRKNKKLQLETLSLHNGSSPNVVTPISRRDDSSASCASATTFTTHDGEIRNLSSISTTSASSFLEDWCSLQKDSGKGYAPGTSVTAHGKHDSMTKLVEKMDVLADIENEGAYANAVLTRVPAKLMSLKRGGSGSLGSSEGSQSGGEGYVETRSMLAVKMGLLSVKYGILVHWNKTSGLAELIVLRKMCSESFMKPGTSKGSWRKRMKHRVGRTSSLGNNTTFATVDTMSTDNATYGSFGLDPIDSFTNRVDDSFG